MLERAIRMWPIHIDEPNWIQLSKVLLKKTAGEFNCLYFSLHSCQAEGTNS